MYGSALIGLLFDELHRQFLFNDFQLKRDGDDSIDNVKRDDHDSKQNGQSIEKENGLVRSVFGHEYATAFHSGTVFKIAGRKNAGAHDK